MTAPSPQNPDEAAAAKPGKIRTWWHPLLVSLLRWKLGRHYQVQEEVPLGQKPLQIDILLLRKEQGDLPAHARAMLAGLVEHLGEETLVEFKSPSDTLRAGDLQTFLAYTLLYRALNKPLLQPSKLHLVVIAPRLTRPYQDELQLLGMTGQTEEVGVWRLQGSPAGHPMWLLETEELVDLQHPLLSVFSPQFRRDRVGVYNSLSQAGYNDLLVYMVQQITQFRVFGEEFAMQHLGAEAEMMKTLQEIIKKLPLEDRLQFVSVDEYPVEDLLKRLPAEERLKGLPAEERLKGLPAEERLKGLPAEERLKGLAAEERLRGLTPEELERLRQLLQHPEATKPGNGG
jgi:hypothetical protein